MTVTADPRINRPIPLEPTAGANIATAAKTGIFQATAMSSLPTNGKVSTDKPAAERLKSSITTNNEQLFKVKINANHPVIVQGIRQALPQQQPLQNLLPLIQHIVQQPSQNISQQLLQNLKTLLQQFPTSQQAAQPKSLQQAINSNGIFFEAKIAQQLIKNHSTNSNNTTRSDITVNNLFNRDLKGMLQLLATQVAKSSVNTTGTEDGKQALTYGSTAPLPLNAEILVSNNNNKASAERGIDVLLKQLSSQLLASLARTQLNQLETLAARSANTPDNQGPINSWTLELPIIHGKNIDNLELRIDQHLIENEEPDDTAEGKKQWTVMLAFDLHALGKMNVQLNIIEKSVSATVWSQLENTHREVKQQVNKLSNSLEKIGVRVKHVDCQLGLPPKSHLLIYRQLVDVRT